MNNEPKVTYMGKKMKWVKKETKLQKVKKLINKVFKLSFIVAVVIGALYLSRYINPVIEYRTEIKEVQIDNLTAKIEKMKWEVVDEIKKFESMGQDESAGLITFDPNPNNPKVRPASIGSYQYKVSTIQYYYKKFYSKELTPKEAILIALDDEKAGQLTYDIVFKEEGGCWNWYHTVNKGKLDKKIEIIRNLEK